MAIPSKQIGGSVNYNLLWQISKQLERLIEVRSNINASTTSTSTSTSSSTTTTTTTLGPIVTIGTQIWTTKNLDVTTYNDGTLIPEATTDADWINKGTNGIGAWCWYANLSSNGTTYGKLYNWYAVNDSRGLAPTGYHIPTDAEWTILTTFLGGTSIAGGKMKSTGTIQAGTGLWNTPNTLATNSSSFTGLPAGNRRNDSLFSNIGNYGYFWSLSEATSTTAWARYLDYTDDNVYRNGYNKIYGFSVRLIKD